MTPAEVLEFWFRGEPDEFRADPWFRKSDAFDTDIRTRFGAAVDAAIAGAFAEWPATPDGTLALLLLLDQFTRNSFRGQARAFAGDARARAAAAAAVAAGQDRGLTKVQRVFVYLPFEHSENLVDQDVSCRLFATICDHPQLTRSRNAAERHRDVIHRFGRYPHRNAALGRICTPEEAAFIAEPGSGF